MATIYLPDKLLVEMARKGVQHPGPFVAESVSLRLEAIPEQEETPGPAAPK